MAQEMIAITVEARQLTEIDRIARRKGITRSQQIREMLDLYLHQMEGE
jgi:metal-responsive CopG/Arc/MetJ family transcriptional regulator